ncbi:MULTISPECIES: hypothetical protein [Aerococcus]|uniref:Uncharacterized protein n=2 Tax=Aerococcus TaxID=1375 RepID=A0A178HIM1_9LACT|nr:MULTISPECIES: hypothetical protein [Aerococcus]KAA9219692.1 hypothetical protein F6I39_03585 [Aerococcus loyolae]KAA9263998.1 hypothetical protein F6I19_08480 [Aerococcus loyolae]MCY3025533.1 hypothetical protein [Aerococcus loyolae]MCY3026521.1 hypothetical protein [Aerococcus loyolae]MCY3028371.1 hypothetical protein [Aerococcus loyolae]
MKNIVLTIIINLVLLVIFTVYIIYVMKLAGKNHKDEMFKHFRQQIFKNIGIAVTIFSGISLFLNVFLLLTYSGNISIDELQIRISNDLKYFILASVVYIINLIRLRFLIHRQEGNEE